MAHLIDARALRARLHDSGEIALLDVREAGQFGEAHLLFATPLPYSRLETEVVRLVPRRSASVIVCDDGELGIAPLAARRLAALGYSDVAILAGGTRAWAEAGYTLFAGVNVPSKLFGELVEHVYHTPRVSVQALVAMRKAGEDVVVLDGRPYAEYQKMNIPGAVCCPNAELPYRLHEIVSSPATKIVVNCAGRTRSIIGAQTLINFGTPNPVYALENGTQGWFLADLKLDAGSTSRYPDDVDPASLPQLQSCARALAARFAVKTVTTAEVQTWMRDANRTTYLCDVRTPEEFAAGSLPGAVHAPGGQLIQATDQWIGVRNARIVLIDGEGVRAPVVASWLAQLGCEAYVLQGGVHAALAATPAAAPLLPRLGTIPVSALAGTTADQPFAIFDLRPSMSFRLSHIPGSRWSIRSRLVTDARPAGRPLVLVADEPEVACAAAIDLAEAGMHDVQLLAGGFTAWTRAALPVEATPDSPPDYECIDYLFFAHDRHRGNHEAAKQYLAWETQLISQLDEQDRQSFRVGSAH